MNLKKNVKNDAGLIIFFILLAIFRLSLISRGHRFDLDEARYLNALYFWIEFFRGSFNQAFAYLFNATARPGFVFVSLIPSGVQLLLVNLKIISFSNLHFYDIPCFFNVLVTVINSILFFQILVLLVSDRMIAIGGTITYSLLVNTNLYIRHLFPYDYSLLLFFIVLLLILRDGKNGQSSLRTALICGALSALGALIYPGYYAMSFIVTFFFVVSLRPNFLMTIMYILCFLGTVMLFEWISNRVGLSYMSEFYVMSIQIGHGSYSEGFLYIVRYIKEVEGAIGFLLFVLFFLYCLYLIFKDATSFKWLLVAAVLMYSFSAVLGVVFHKMVFYGRTLHMYFPFLVLAAARSISLIPRQIVRRYLITILILCSIFSFIPSAYTYSRLSYPGDIFFKYLSHIPLNRILWISSNEKLAPDIDKKYSAILLNFEAYDHIGYKPPSFPSSMVRTLVLPHPLNFSAYTFEDYSPQERELIKKSRYQMQLYLDSHLVNKTDNGGGNSDQDSFYKAFNPRLPFIYTRNWLGEYNCTKFIIQDGRVFELDTGCQK